MFRKDHYIKYLSWMSCDPSREVRLIATGTLLRVYDAALGAANNPDDPHNYKTLKRYVVKHG